MLLAAAFWTPFSPIEDKKSFSFCEPNSSPFFALQSLAPSFKSAVRGTDSASSAVSRAKELLGQRRKACLLGRDGRAAKGSAARPAATGLAPAPLSAGLLSFSFFLPGLGLTLTSSSLRCWRLSAFLFAAKGSAVRPAATGMIATSGSAVWPATNGTKGSAIIPATSGCA